MEQLQIINNGVHPSSDATNHNQFIEANTLPMDFNTVKQDHLIPVFIKDNEPVISHVEFIQTVVSMVNHCFGGQPITNPSIRVSHPIKGRIPEAKGKPAKELLEHEKTIYYERMAFMVELPQIRQVINGNEVNLTVGGVKAYNQDNLYSTSGGIQHFKTFIGFKNTVCTNLCIWTDGYKSDMKVRTLNDLTEQTYVLLSNFDMNRQLELLQDLGNYKLSEQQFAQLVGRARMYHSLPAKRRKSLPTLEISDTQITTITKGYYGDEDFGKRSDGSIDLWSLYNLFTGANKTSYIDTFLDRGVNAMQFTVGVKEAITSNESHWFLQ